MEEKYTIKDFVKDVGLNILGEIGGDAVEVALGKIKDYFKSAKDRKAVYEKFCKLYNAENSEVKAYLDAVGDANKPKNSEKNINKFFSEFYTVLGVNREQIKNALKDDENFSRLSDNSQNAIVDMINEIRSYYYQFKFPVNDTDKLAAINLLLFRMDENSGKVDKRLDDIDSKLNLLIQRVGSVASDKDGNVTLGAVAHFAEREYHIIACPDCGSHDDAFVEAYIAGKQNGKVSCPACGNTVDYEVVSSKYEQQLDAIYAEINALKLQLKDVTPQQIADKVFELAGNYFDDKVVVSEQTLAQYLNSHTAEIIDRLKNVFNEHDFEQAENIRKLLLAEMKKQYINKNQIYSYASDLCKVPGFSGDFFAKLCLNISRDNPDHKQLAQDIYSICRDSNYTEKYGAVLIDYMLYKDFRLVNKTTRNSFGALIERTYDGDDNDSLKNRKSLTQEVNEKTDARIKGVFETKTHRDIFLIYSSKDIVEAARLCDYLESQCITDKNTGRQKLITCFFSLRNMDNDHEETDYKPRIKEAIKNCSAILFIRSRNSLSSDCDAVLNIENGNFGEIDYVRQCDIENLKEEKYYELYEKWRKNEIEYVDIPRYCKKPRIQYVLNVGHDPEDELNYRTVNEFFGTDTACYPHDDSHIVKSYQKLVIDKEWWAEEPQEEERSKKIADLLNSAEIAYNKKDYEGALVLYAKAEKLGSVTAQTMKVKVSGELDEQKRIAEEKQKKEEIASLLEQADIAYEAKDYQKAVDLYSKAEKLGNQTAKDKKAKAGKALAKVTAEAEERRRAEEQRKAKEKRKVAKHTDVPMPSFIENGLTQSDINEIEVNSVNLKKCEKRDNIFIIVEIIMAIIVFIFGIYGPIFDPWWIDIIVLFVGVLAIDIWLIIFLKGKYSKVVSILFKCWRFERKGCYEEALKWYALAAQQGGADAQYWLGICYAYGGEGVTINDEEAAKWFTLAAKQGLKNAQYELGYCYSIGKGVSQDDTEAVKWYRLAAEQNDSNAQGALGECYYKGKGVEQDYNEAVKWFHKAARKKNTTAQYNLAVCYYNGEGVIRDIKKAKKWYRKAAKKGNEQAQAMLDKINKSDEAS